MEVSSGAMVQPEIKVLSDAEAVAAEAAERVVRAANDAIPAAGRFAIALSGGSTPKLLYRLLAERHRDAIDWARVDVYFGDERCVPPDHAESNYRMARETLLSAVPIPEGQVHRMRGGIDPQEAAKEYGLLLKAQFGDGGLDLVFLGMGEDGHTLSLFPGTDAVREREHRVVANYAEHSTTGKSWRITMTAPFVNRANGVIVAV